MLDLKLYIVSYTLLIRGGHGSPVLQKCPDQLSAFINESDMLEEVAKLKKNNCVENIKVYVNKYEFKSCEKYEI